MTVICKQKCAVIGYNKEKAEKWLQEWVDAWERIGWVCTKWGHPAEHHRYAQIETTLEVGDDDEL